MVTTKFHESNEPWKIVSSSSSTCLFLIFFFFFSFRYFYKFCIFHLRIPSYFTFFLPSNLWFFKRIQILEFFSEWWDRLKDSIFFLAFSFCSISFKVSYFLYPLHSCISTPLIISLLLLLPFEFSLFIHLSCSPSVRIPLCPDIISRGSCRNISRHQYSPFPLEWNSLPLFFFLLLSFFPFFFPFFPFFRNRPRIINGRTILFASPFFQ